MYVPRRYEEKDKEKVFAFMREYSFGILVSVKDGLPVGTHIPLLLGKNEAGEDTLTGHIARGNEQKYSLTDGAKVLAIFAGPHAYVSPRWYTEMNVPTWDYISVHVYGVIRIMEGEELKTALSRLVDNYEQGLPQPVKLEEIPEKTFHDNFRGIVGFEIRIEEIQAAYKVSQNRNKESYHQVIDQLDQGDELSRKIASEMKERAGELFHTGKEPLSDAGKGSSYGGGKEPSANEGKESSSNTGKESHS